MAGVLSAAPLTVAMVLSSCAPAGFYRIGRWVGDPAGQRGLSCGGRAAPDRAAEGLAFLQLDGACKAAASVARTRPAT